MDTGRRERNDASSRHAEQRTNCKHTASPSTVTARKGRLIAVFLAFLDFSA
jgi:hypothetical protein